MYCCRFVYVIPDLESHDGEGGVWRLVGSGLRLYGYYFGGLGTSMRAAGTGENKQRGKTY